MYVRRHTLTMSQLLFIYLFIYFVFHPPADGEK